MSTIKRFWKYLSGYKTTISALYWTALIPSLMVIFPTGTPPEIMKPVTIIGFFLGALGLGHKAAKKFVEENDAITKD